MRMNAIIIPVLQIFVCVSEFCIFSIAAVKERKKNTIKQWLDTTQIYYLTVLKVRNLKWVIKG